MNPLLGCAQVCLLIGLVGQVQRGGSLGAPRAYAIDHHSEMLQWAEKVRWCDGGIAISIGAASTASIGYAYSIDAYNLSSWHIALCAISIRSSHHKQSRSYPRPF